MDNAAIEKIATETPHPGASKSASPPSRTPFTRLGQVDADLALARALQEQERALMMIKMDGPKSGSYVFGDEFECDDFDHHHHLDLYDDDRESFERSDFESDEAFARVLQDAEETVRLMELAGLNDWGAVEHGEHARQSQDASQEVDTDGLSYEELVALGEVVGTEIRGLSADMIAALPLVDYKAQSSRDGDTDRCVICRVEYEDGECLIALSCEHLYHPECINRWLQTNKVCPICSCEVLITSSGQ